MCFFKALFLLKNFKKKPGEVKIIFLLFFLITPKSLLLDLKFKVKKKNGILIIFLVFTKKNHFKKNLLNKKAYKGKYKKKKSFIINKNAFVKKKSFK